MASAQATDLGEQQQKAKVLKIVEEAKRIGNEELVDESLCKDSGGGKEQDSAVIRMKNDTTAMVNVDQRFNWSGRTIGVSYPPAIRSQESRHFTHAGKSPTGSKGAVVYYGMNKDGVECGWLLAWNTPTNLSDENPNRVYVNCGPKSDFDTIGWETIRKKLDVSDSYVNKKDPTTQTNIAAHVSSSGEFAAVGACFGIEN